MLGTLCGKEVFAKFIKYLDREVMSDKEGIDMVRYYGIIGPQVVTAMENDPEKVVVSKYLYAEYISKLDHKIFFII